MEVSTNPIEINNKTNSKNKNTNQAQLKTQVSQNSVIVETQNFSPKNSSNSNNNNNNQNNQKPGTDRVKNKLIEQDTRTRKNSGSSQTNNNNGSNKKYNSNSNQSNNLYYNKHDWASNYYYDKKNNYEYELDVSDPYGFGCDYIKNVYLKFFLSYNFLLLNFLLVDKFLSCFVTALKSKLFSAGNRLRT